MKTATLEIQTRGGMCTVDMERITREMSRHGTGDKIDVVDMEFLMVRVNGIVVLDVELSHARLFAATVFAATEPPRLLLPSFAPLRLLPPASLG